MLSSHSHTHSPSPSVVGIPHVSYPHPPPHPHYFSFPSTPIPHNYYSPAILPSYQAQTNHYPTTTAAVAVSASSSAPVSVSVVQPIPISIPPIAPNLSHFQHLQNYFQANPTPHQIPHTHHHTHNQNHHQHQLFHQNTNPIQPTNIHLPQHQLASFPFSSQLPASNPPLPMTLTHQHHSQSHTADLPHSSVSLSDSVPPSHSPKSSRRYIRKKNLPDWSPSAIAKFRREQQNQSQRRRREEKKREKISSAAVAAFASPFPVTVATVANTVESSNLIRNTEVSLSLPTENQSNSLNQLVAAAIPAVTVNQPDADSQSQSHSVSPWPVQLNIRHARKRRNRPIEEQFAEAKYRPHETTKFIDEAAKSLHSDSQSQTVNRFIGDSIPTSDSLIQFSSRSHAIQSVHHDQAYQHSAIRNEQTEFDDEPTHQFQ